MVLNVSLVQPCGCSPSQEGLKGCSGAIDRQLAGIVAGPWNISGCGATRTQISSCRSSMGTSSAFERTFDDSGTRLFVHATREGGAATGEAEKAGTYVFINRLLVSHLCSRVHARKRTTAMKRRQIKANFGTLEPETGERVTTSGASFSGHPLFALLKGPSSCPSRQGQCAIRKSQCPQALPYPQPTPEFVSSTSPHLV